MFFIVEFEQRYRTGILNLSTQFSEVHGQACKQGQERGGSLVPKLWNKWGCFEPGDKEQWEKDKKKGRVQVRNVSSQTGNTNRKFHNSNSLGEGRGALKLKTFL